MNCTDCRNTIPAGKGIVRSISFERVTLCPSCAASRGWERIVPSQRHETDPDVVEAYAKARKPLGVEFASAIVAGVNDAEAYANGITR